MVSTALLALAGALACFPHRIAADRIALLWPAGVRARRRWRLGGPVAIGALAGLLTAGPGGALAGVLLAITVGRARAARAGRSSG